MQEKVWTGAIQVPKVRGGAAPADLFTKHLASRGKIHQLVKLFGFDYRVDRSAAAPLLHPLGSSGGTGSQPATGHLPTLITLQAEVDVQEAHDLEILPHLYEQRAMDRIFPSLDAPLAGPSVDNWDYDDLHEDVQKAQEKLRRGASHLLPGGAG